MLICSKAKQSTTGRFVIAIARRGDGGGKIAAAILDSLIIKHNSPGPVIKSVEQQLCISLTDNDSNVFGDVDL